MANGKYIPLALLLFFLTANSCDRKSPNPVSDNTSETGKRLGTLVLNISASPWQKVLARSMAIEAMDSVKIVVFSSSGNREIDQNLVKSGTRWQGSITVPAQNNMRVALAYFGGAAVRYLGEKSGVNVSPGGTTSIDISLNYLGLAVAAPDSACAEFKVRWTSRPLVTGYQLQQDTKTDFSTAANIYSGSDTTYIVSFQGKTPGQVYYYRVRVNTVFGYGPWYSRDGASSAGSSKGTNILEAPGTVIIQGIPLKLIPAGSFMMGSLSGDSDEKPIHSVTLSDFEMSMYEVSQGQYRSVTGTNPAFFSGDDDLPVECVSWREAVSFCNKLSAVAGLQSCYDVSKWICDFEKNGFRLPTEAEWEYACRAGSTTVYNLGDDTSDLARAGWYAANSFLTTHPVGRKTPNAWGLCDMLGNVWEMCNDWYGNYSSGSQFNPTGEKTGSYSVIRGGGWGVGDCWSTMRSSCDRDDKYYHLGFRIVRRTQ